MKLSYFDFRVWDGRKYVNNIKGGVYIHKEGTDVKCLNRNQDCYDYEFQLDDLDNSNLEIELFSRKKDAIVNNEEDIFKNVFGSHNERLIANYYISSEEDFEKYCKVSEHIVNNIPYTRAYFNVNPKSKKKALLHLNDRVNQLVTNFIMSVWVNPSTHLCVNKKDFEHYEIGYSVIYPKYDLESLLA